MVTFLRFSFAVFWWGRVLCLFMYPFVACFCRVEFSCGDILDFQLLFLLGKRSGEVLGVSLLRYIYLSHGKKNSYFPLYWLAKRDPYFMNYYNPYITG